MNIRAFSSLIFLFLGLTAVFCLMWIVNKNSAVDYRVLIGGNGLLFVIGMVSLKMNTGALNHQNTQGFLKLVYGAFLLKFFVLAVAAFIYIAIFKKAINKPGLFGCFGLYFIYTFIEMRSVLKQPKKQNA